MFGSVCLFVGPFVRALSSNCVRSNAVLFMQRCKHDTVINRAPSTNCTVGVIKCCDNPICPAKGRYSAGSTIHHLGGDVVEIFTVTIFPRQASRFIFFWEEPPISFFPRSASELFCHFIYFYRTTTAF